MTIRELIAEPHLGLRLLAGDSGLDHQITWSHTSDLPKLWEWVSDGVLLLTNGMSIPPDAHGQIELARRLRLAGAVGLAVGEKMHAPEFTAAFLEACNELELAVLSVPYPLPFIAISRSIAEALLIEESQRIKQTARIYDFLRRASSPTDSWNMLLSELSTELKSTLYVLDKSCLHLWNSDDQAPAPETFDAISHAAGQARESTRNFQWVDFSGHSLMMVDIPIHAGAVLVVLPEADAGHPDGVILLHCATVLGLALSQQVMLMSQTYRAANAVLSQIVHGGELPEELPEVFLSEKPMRLACFPAQSGGKLDEISQRLLRHGVENFIAAADDASYIFFDADASPQSLWHVLEDAKEVGVSSAVTVRQYPRALREAHWMRAKSRDQSGGILFHNDDESWFGLAGHREGQELIARILGPIIDHDRRANSDLLGTLRTYLDYQRSPQKVADATFTHRQTVIGRLRKIEQLAGFDLAQTAVIAQLWLAFKALDALRLPAMASSHG